jgi:hypothetical protein
MLTAVIRPSEQTSTQRQQFGQVGLFFQWAFRFTDRWRAIAFSHTHYIKHPRCWKKPFHVKEERLIPMTSPAVGKLKRPLSGVFSNVRVSHANDLAYGNEKHQVCF